MLAPSLWTAWFPMGPASERRCKINFSIPIGPTLYNPLDREFWTPAICLVFPNQTSTWCLDGPRNRTKPSSPCNVGSQWLSWLAEGPTPHASHKPHARTPHSLSRIFPHCHPLEFEGMCRAFYDLCPIWICCQEGLDLLVHFKAFQGTQDSRRSVAQSVDPSQTCPAGQESGTYHPPSALVSSILSPSKSPLLKVAPRDLDLLQQSPWLVLQTLLYQIFLSDFVCCLSWSMTGPCLSIWLLCSGV